LAAQFLIFTTKTMFRKIILGALLLLLMGSFAPIQAQSIRKTTNNNHGWFMYFGDHKFSKKWGLHLETQVRRHDVVSDWQQLLLRPGINYHFSDNAFATVGYCYVHTWPYGEFASKSEFPENRWWEQIQYKTQTGRIEWVNRLRLEQRFVHNPVAQDDGTFAAGDAVYSNRMRWLNRVSIPFKGDKIADKSLYITAYDEVLVSFGKNVQNNLFDQNRAYIALGYRLPKVGRLELGYMNQLLLKSDGVRLENNHTLMVGLSSNIALRG
jgi:hypothetical protein